MVWDLSRSKTLWTAVCPPVLRSFLRPANRLGIWFFKYHFRKGHSCPPSVRLPIVIRRVGSQSNPDSRSGTVDHTLAPIRGQVQKECRASKKSTGFLIGPRACSVLNLRPRAGSGLVHQPIATPSLLARSKMRGQAKECLFVGAAGQWSRRLSIRSPRSPRDRQVCSCSR